MHYATPGSEWGDGNVGIVSVVNGAVKGEVAFDVSDDGALLWMDEIYLVFLGAQQTMPPEDLS